MTEILWTNVDIDVLSYHGTKSCGLAYEIMTDACLMSDDNHV